MHLMLAQEIVELHAGTTEAATRAVDVSSMDMHRLKMATIFEAIFAANHPEILTVQAVNSASGDGISADYQFADAQWLAPLAQRQIARLSWKLAPLRVRPPGARGTDPTAVRGSRDSAARDDARQWAPMRRP